MTQYRIGLYFGSSLLRAHNCQGLVTNQIRNVPACAACESVVEDLHIDAILRNADDYKL
jgi:hypothetical protein